MGIFDDTIRELRNWFQGKLAQGEARRYEALPHAMGEQARASSARKNPTIILREDTYIELGHPSVGSCSAALATHEPSLVMNGQITLVGPDVAETSQKAVPFAQIAIARSTADIEETSSAMDKVLHISAQTEGYMLRSIPTMVWARVSKEAARSGFSLYQHGSRLLSLLREECADIVAAEILFATSSREDVAGLKAIVEKANNKLRKLMTYERKPDGTYECMTALDCNECSEKPICDTIREVITIRKGDRLITLERKSRTSRREHGHS
jgi:CO dehydrogenase/acetyl-CoA synthase beta subunit